MMDKFTDHRPASMQRRLARRCSHLHAEVPIGVWLRVHVQNALRHRVDLVLAIDIALSIAGQGCRAARVWLIKLDRAIRASQGGVD